MDFVSNTISAATRRIWLKALEWTCQIDIHTSCQNGWPNLVEMLLAVDGVQVNQGRYGRTPLCDACQNGHSKVVEILLAVDGILVNQANNIGRTPLNNACWEGHLKVVDMLLDIKYYIRRLVYIA